MKSSARRLVKPASVTHGEEIERYRKRSHERLLEVESLIEEELAACGFEWIGATLRSIICGRCNEKLKWTAVVWPDTFELRRNFIRIHSQCMAQRVPRKKGL